MSDDKIKNKVSFKTKSSEFVLPVGAKLDSKSFKLEVEEIENGFLITKTTEIKYYPKDQTYRDYKDIVKKYYSATNPFEDKTGESTKSLADYFEE